MRGNEPLSLGNREIAWKLDSGEAAVFAVDFEDGQPAGARRYLFTARRGDVLLGMSAAEGSKHRELIAVPLEDLHASVVAPDMVAVQTWLTNLGPALAGLHPSGASILSQDSDRVHLESGQAVVCELPVTWLKVVRGSVSLLGYRDTRVSQPGGQFAIGKGMWIVAEEPSELERVENSDGTLEALALLEPLIFRALVELDNVQIEQERSRFLERRARDERLAAETVHHLASVALPRAEVVASSSDPPLLAAVRAIGRAEGIEFRPALAAGEHLDPLRAIAQSSGVRTRRVLLAGRWWEQENSSLLAFQTEQKRPVALIQSHTSGARRCRYILFDPALGTHQPVEAGIASTLEPVAFSFYRPFSATVGTWDLVKFGARFSRRDMATILFCGVAAILLGMAGPQASSVLFSQAIPDGDRGLLWQVAIGLGAAVVGAALFDFTQSTSVLRAQSTMGAGLQAGLWDRLLKMSPAFFRKYTVGDLRARVGGATKIQNLLSLEVLRTITVGLFSSLYLFLMVYYNLALGLIGCAAGLMLVCGTAISAQKAAKLEDSQQTMEGELDGLLLQLINGVSKIRVAGAEQRAFTYWAKLYAQKEKVVAQVRKAHDRVRTWNVTIPLLATALSFWFVLDKPPDSAGGLPLGTFVAFTLALGIFMLALSSLSDTAMDLVKIGSIWARTKPILNAVPEVDEGKSHPGILRGRVVFDHVSFRYMKDGPLTLEDVCLSADPGECIALVGPSGSGKSTILNLLLRFESPASGAIYLDGQELSGLDIAAVRRQFGVVNQDSRLMSNSIFENIVCGGLSILDDAWEAARAAGLAEDIEQMPMGMHTIVSQGGSNISGGQRQRILIARALVMKPRILIFDEATSALDNRTQQIVTESLSKLKVTRIIVAHRLSTIRNADRIFVIENGRVLQQGTYESLMNEAGLFARLMKRQLA